MATKSEELAQTIVDMYTEREPTPETSAEIVKEIAEELEQSPNAVRMILVNAKVYVKKDAATTTTKASTKDSGEGSKRVSKESLHAALKEAIVASGSAVDEDIVSKLTGKAAAYFTSILKK